MSSSKTSAWEGLGRADETFQRLLLRSPLMGGDRANSPIRKFCQSTRESLRVDGAYLWRLSPPDELVGAEADGLMADLFGGTRLRASENAVLNDAIQQRRTVYVNRLPLRFKLASQLQARALMAAPVVVADRVVGAAAFLHMSDPDFFNDDLAEKATALTGQLGNLLEAGSSTAVEEDPPADGRELEIVESQLVQGPGALLQALAARLRVLLHTRLVCVLRDQGNGFHLETVSAETPAMAAAIRARNDRRSLQFAADLAARALAARAPITVSIDPSAYPPDLVPAGLLIATPFTTANSRGAVLVYPRREGSFSPSDTTLIAALTESTAAALAHEEQHISSDAKARESQDLLGIVSELNSITDLDAFLQRLVQRATGFLGFARSCVGLLQDGTLHLCWQAVGEHTTPLDLYLPLHGAMSRTLLNQETFWTDNFSNLSVPDVPRIGDADLRQVLAVPLVGSDARVLGMMAALERVDGGTISPDDLRRAKLLAAQMGPALEKFRMFRRMDHANRHWVEIFDAISDFIVVHDETNKVLRVNRTLADFVGVPPAPLIGVEMSALFGMESPAALHSCPFCAEDRATAGQTHTILEHTYLVSTSQVFAGNREAPQTIHVLKDITDTQEAERRYRELFGNIQEGLFFSTPDGRFVEVNGALVHMLGYGGREDLLQLDIRSQVFSSPERHEAFAEQMRQHGGVRNYEEALRRQDGAPVYVLINGFAVRDHLGRIVQYRGLILDVSGLKTFQSELQRERDFSGKILNNTQSLILVADITGHISYANRRWFDMGYEQRHLLGLPLQELVSAGRRTQLNEALIATRQGQQVDNLELQILRGDGSVGQFSVNLSPMRDDQGAVSSVVVVMTDVTDAATLQAKLMHAEKMAAVGQLVSGVAHEVNNPLTAILGFADLLMESNDVSDVVRRDLRVILQEAQRTKQIVQNLLSFARQMPPQRVPVQLNSILRRTVQLRAYDFNSHGVAVIEQFDEALPDVVGDAQQLQQVFLNILNNAYDAVRESGRPARIEIMTARRGSRVEVVFRDNGPGISHPDRIFDPFFTTKEVGKGTGLGLSICYGIVQQHGGEILCHNNADGPGATFIVRLPSVPEGASPGASGANPS